MPLPLLPATGLRTNLGTWAVRDAQLPALGHWMHDILPNESFDPHFYGQNLETTYFDAPRFALRKARRQGSRYLTLRIRCYDAPGKPDAYALSVKTEDQKWRQEIANDQAEAAYETVNARPLLMPLLPVDLQARLLELIGDEPLVPVVCVCCRRYAVEDEIDRYTLDVGVRTDTGLCLPASVLEWKSTHKEKTPPGSLQMLHLRPLKLSKFLWATGV
jgi:hypothetical protein